MSIAEKLTTIAENEKKVYEAGKKSEYDKFWDSCQNYGKRTYYRNAFLDLSWNDITFKPKYDIKPTAFNALNMFGNSAITNLKQILIDCGVKLDLSEVINAQQMFSGSAITHIPALNLTNATNCNSILASCTSLISVDLIQIGKNPTFSTAFNNCNELEEIRFEGVIGQNGFNMKWSKKLSKASITSIINALSTTTSGLSITLSVEAVWDAFGATTEPEWVALVESRPNWTISLV